MAYLTREDMERVRFIRMLQVGKGMDIIKRFPRAVPTKDRWLARIDSTGPLQNDYDVMDPQQIPGVFDFDWYRRKAYEGLGCTYGDMALRVEQMPKFKEYYADTGELISHIAPNEWQLNMDATVRDGGCERNLHSGVLKTCFAMGSGLADELLRWSLFSPELKYRPAYFCGVTGGSGAGGSFIIPKWYEDRGFDPLLILALTHVASLQVYGTVPERNVIRTQQMLRMHPGSVLFSGVPAVFPNGLDTWDHLRYIVPDLVELVSNVGTLSTDARLAKAEEATVDALLVLGLNYRRNIFSILYSQLLQQAGRLTADQAVKKLSTAFADRTLRFTNIKDQDYQHVVLSSADLPIDTVMEVIPALAYVHANPVHIRTTIPGKGWSRDKDIDVTLWGAPLMKDIMEDMGVSEVTELTDAANGGTFYFENWFLKWARNKPQDEVETALLQNWPHICGQFAGKLLDGNEMFEGGHLNGAPGGHLRWTQLHVPAEKLALDGLGVVGDNIEDPAVRRASEAAATAAAAATLAGEDAMRSTVEKLR
jgi:hypothetical protein